MDFSRLDIREHIVVISITPVDPDIKSEREISLFIGAEIELLSVSSSLPPEEAATIFHAKINDLAHLMRSQVRSSTELEITNPCHDFVVDTPGIGVKILSDQIREDFLLVAPPPTVRHKLVRAYHNELLSQISGMECHPSSADAIIYPKFKKYYQKIFEFLFSTLKLSTDALEPISRHRFFICSEPVEINGQMVLGLPELSKLMGYSLNQTTDTPAQKDDFDPITKLTADILLIFKGRARWLLENYGVGELNQIAIAASNRLAEAQDYNNEQPNGHRVVTPPKTLNIKDPEELARSKGAIASQLQDLDVPLPDDWS